MEMIDQNRDPADAEAAVEVAVLMLLLSVHPAQVTFDELLRMMTAHEPDFGERDAIGLAVEELAASGLAHRNGEAVFASRAAVRCDELLSR